MDDVYVSYAELKPGDIFLGTTRNPNWSYECFVTRRTGNEVFFRKSHEWLDGNDYPLWNDPDRKYRLKQTTFKYDPNQTGDREDDI